MENPIVKLFENISEEELKKAILEIKKDNLTGIIHEGGIVRKYAKLIGNITDEPISANLMMSQINLLKEAAFRWVDKV